MVTLKGFSIFAWEWLMNYIYYSSPGYGYVGCLLGAFGLGTLVYPCQKHASASDQATAEDTYDLAQYTKILQTTIAVIIMLIVDMALSLGRASDLCTQALLKTQLSIDSWFQAIMLGRDASGAISEDGVASVKTRHNIW